MTSPHSHALKQPATKPNLPGYLRLGLIGHPVSHSVSPLMQEAWLKASNLDGCYKAYDVAQSDLKAFTESVRVGDTAYPIHGFNVTVPHKENIIEHLDALAPQAKRLGAVNTVRVVDGKLTGFNTDGLGFLAPLVKPNSLYRASLDAGRPALLIGAGGAARAVLSALLTTNVPLVMVLNRTRARAEELVETLGSGRTTVVDWADRADAVAAAGLIVNSTSLGMAGQPALDINLSSAASGSCVYDIVYNPLETVLLASARARGLSVLDGLHMLIGQGAAAFKLWTGIDADPDKVRPLLEASLTANRPAQAQPLKGDGQ